MESSGAQGPDGVEAVVWFPGQPLLVLGDYSLLGWEQLKPSIKQVPLKHKDKAQV